MVGAPLEARTMKLVGERTAELVGEYHAAKRATGGNAAEQHFVATFHTPRSDPIIQSKRHRCRNAIAVRAKVAQHTARIPVVRDETIEPKAACLVRADPIDGTDGVQAIEAARKACEVGAIQGSSSSSAAHEAWHHAGTM